MKIPGLTSFLATALLGTPSLGVVLKLYEASDCTGAEIERNVWVSPSTALYNMKTPPSRRKFLTILPPGKSTFEVLTWFVLERTTPVPIPTAFPPSK
jgi:hypothetical protein